MSTTFESLVSFRYLRADKLRYHVIFASFVLLLGGLGVFLSGKIINNPASSLNRFIYPVGGGLILAGLALLALRVFKKLPAFIVAFSISCVAAGAGAVAFRLMLSIPGFTPQAVNLISSYTSIILFSLGALVLIFGFILFFFNVYSTISIFGVFLGTTTMVVVLSVLGGLEGEQKSQILSFSPHIVIEGNEQQHIENWEKYSKIIDDSLKASSIKGIAAPYLEEEVLLKSATFEATQGVLLRGISPLHPTFNLEKHMISGTISNLIIPSRVKWLDSGVIYSIIMTSSGQAVLPWPADTPGIIISAEQARTLGVSLGSAIDIISPRGTMSPTGPIPKLLRFRIAGIYSTKYFKYDLKYAFVTIGSAALFSQKKNSVSGWELRLNNIKKIDTAAASLRKNLPDSFVIGTWESRNRALFNAMKLEKFVMFLILIVIILVAAFSITANLIMVVMDKQQEISILKSIGSTDRSISFIFMLQGVFIGLIGLILGLTAGLGICGYLAKVGIRMSENIFLFARIPVSVNALDILMISCTSIVLTVLATVYPSWKAMKVSPIEGLYDDK
ncbi:ABC transporter permease [Myxococcota bacterium]|nr:ABC transporter permease [Myxococcota bacterium]MBU1383128.1 ABC transporter permease [Myxococcota bacterium]MBU1499049.1 ABC transporter permease [Myxococcota bacterium]